MQVEPIASAITDNFFYLVTSGDDALLVDPIDAERAIARVRAASFSRVRVLTTHGHPDHAAGNAEVAEALGAEVLAPAVASAWPVPHDRGLRHGERIALGKEELEVIAAPGHTDDHLVFRCGDLLISGDVYFVGGAANCRNGGDAAELHRTFTERLAHLPDSVRFFPGHDYAEKNLRFCLEVEAENARAAELLAGAERWERDQGPFLVTLGEERAYNPFHRTAEPALQERVASLDAADGFGSDEEASLRTFRALRALRDVY